MEALEYFRKRSGSTQADYIEGLLNRRVLEPLNGTTKTFTKGTVFVPCSDGDRFDDLYHHHKDRCFTDSRMHHPLAFHGGAMLLAQDPAIEGIYSGIGAIWLLGIEHGLTLKKDPTVVLYTHAPCGMAKMLGWDTPQILQRHKVGSDILTRHLSTKRPGTRIVSLFHIDFAKIDGDHPDYPIDRQFRTYLFNPARFK